MPSSVYDPISSALKNSFYGGSKSGSSSLDSRMESGLQKSMLMNVQFDDPVKQSPSLSPSQKSKYTILNATSNIDKSPANGDTSNKQSPGKLDQVPEPKQTLYRREQVELGYRAPIGPGAGMFNMGNTCYLNSTLQALFHTPAFVNYLKYGGHENSCGLNGFSCTVCIMAATLKSTSSSNVMKPVKIYEKLKMICKHLTHGRQEDAHEFLRYLIESLQKCYLISRKVPKTIDNYTKETTPFNQIFGGYMRQDVVCLKCRHVSTTFQHFMDLLLDIRQADHIDAALSGYFRRESLGQGENMYKCEKCKQKVPATKQYKIERPPMVLCIQLKRFNLMGGKNGRPVTLARKLSITNHVRWAPARGIAVEYKLVSMITHVGPSPNCGHYTSIGEAGNGTFYRFDDASVHPTSLQNALNTSAYVIFYEMLPKTKSTILSPQQPAKMSSASPQLKPKQDAVSSDSVKNGQKSPQINLIGTQKSSQNIIGPNLPNQTKSTGHQLPTPIKNRPTLISEPMKITPKPKIISEPPKQKPTDKAAEKPPIKKGLVPYGDGSSSDEEGDTSNPQSSKPIANTSQLDSKVISNNVNLSPKPTLSTLAKPVSSNQSITPSKDSPKPSTSSSLISNSSQKSPETPLKLSSSKPPCSPNPKIKASVSPNNLGDKKPTASISSPFLPRSVAANLKKIKESVKNEIPAVLKGVNNSPPINHKPLTNPKDHKQHDAPNRDPSAEALYSSQSKQRAFSPPSTELGSKSVVHKTPQSKNEFVVTDVDSHNPSIHSDNSNGSTASFTVTDLPSGVSCRTNSENGSNTASRQFWNITPASSSSKSAPAITSMKVNGTASSSKRERSVPPKLSPTTNETEKDKDEVLSESELMGSPKKRKKVGWGGGGIFDEANLLEKAAEIGKDVWNAGTKMGKNLFKSSKSSASKISQQDFESESVTSCEATTSYQDEKPTSSTSSLKEEISLDADDENDDDLKSSKKHKKKKKKKKKKYDDEKDEEQWEEKTKDNLDKYSKHTEEENVKLQTNKYKSSLENVTKVVKESSSNPSAPVKKWDAKPELKTIGRSVTWDGSKGSSVYQELLKGTEIRSWSGDRSTLERNQEPRKRCADSDLDDELDRGKTKKVKKTKEEAGAYKFNQNPFQIAQNITNRGEKFHDRHNESKSGDHRRSSDSWSRDNSKRSYPDNKHSRHQSDQRQRYWQNDHRDHHKRHDRHSSGPRQSNSDRR